MSYISLIDTSESEVYINLSRKNSYNEEQDQIHILKSIQEYEKLLSFIDFELFLYLPLYEKDHQICNQITENLIDDATINSESRKRDAFIQSQINPKSDLDHSKIKLIEEPPLVFHLKQTLQLPKHVNQQDLFAGFTVNLKQIGSQQSSSARRAQQNLVEKMSPMRSARVFTTPQEVEQKPPRPIQGPFQPSQSQMRKLSRICVNSRNIVPELTPLMYQELVMKEQRQEDIILIKRRQNLLNSPLRQKLKPRQ